MKEIKVLEDYYFEIYTDCKPKFESFLLENGMKDFRVLKLDKKMQIMDTDHTGAKTLRCYQILWVYSLWKLNNQVNAKIMVVPKNLMEQKNEEGHVMLTTMILHSLSSKSKKAFMPLLFTDGNPNDFIDFICNAERYKSLKDLLCIGTPDKLIELSSFSG